MKIWRIYCILCCIIMKFGSNCRGEIRFRKEYYADIDKRLKFIGSKIPGRWKGHYFHQLNDEERRQLCYTAQNNVDFEEMSIAYDRYAPQLHEFQLDVKWLRSTLVIECQTVPTSYLQYNETEKEIVVLMEVNEFMDESRSFYVETVKNDPEECRETLKNDPKNFDMTNAKFDELVQDECQNNFALVTSQLQTMTSGKLLNLCHAAKMKRTEQKFIELVFKDARVNVPQLYTFTYSSGRKETRAAIKCPTIPPIFLHFINLRVNEDVKVIIAKKGKN